MMDKCVVRTSIIYFNDLFDLSGLSFYTCYQLIAGSHMQNVNANTRHGVELQFARDLTR